VRTPTPSDLYFAAHPRAKAFVESQGPPPASYATLAYFGVNSFEFTNEEGEVSIGRYRIEPEAGIEYLPTEQRSNAGPDYLSREIRDRVTRGPIRFRFRVQVAVPSDVIDDPSIAWPNDRRMIDLGTIEITDVVQDSDAAERALLFLPAELPPGIAPADPMIQARHDAYPVSFDRRHH
jgi:catalase